MKRISVIKCNKCGKELEIPDLIWDKDRTNVLHPYCPSYGIYVVQHLIYRGWHVRNLGMNDNHPYICPDCWTAGTPEYKKLDCCDDWGEQAMVWANENNEK